MSQHQQNIERIDKYLFGQMTAAEKQQFEEAIKSDAGLAKALATQKLEQRTMQLLALKDVKANLDTWRKEEKAGQNKEAKVISMAERAARRRRIFQYAAAAIFILVMGFFFGNQWAIQNYSNDALALNFFENSMNKVRGEEDFPVIYQPAVSAMINENYEQAIQLLGNIQQENYIETAQLLQAECYFQLSNYENTIQISQGIVQTGNDASNIEKAEWFLVLAYFATSQDEQANQLLDKILANENHALYPRAVELNKDLDSFWSRLVN